MPSLPTQFKLSGTSADILNTIRDNASTAYKTAVGIADAKDVFSLRMVGDSIMSLPALTNEFLDALVNRIAANIIAWKTYANPLSRFKKGLLQTGETIEEIFIELATVHDYDPEDAETKLFAREMPDVRSAFHAINYEKYYEYTVMQPELQKAFVTMDGVTSLISKLTANLTKSSEYDEFVVMKWMLARLYLDGFIKTVQIAAPTKENSNSNLATIRATSDKMTAISTKYNKMGVHSNCPPENQSIITTADFQAITSVESLAAAFNLSYADFTTQRVGIDEFGVHDYDRLTAIFGGDPKYVAFTDTEKAKLAKLHGFIMDNDFFMIYDTLRQIGEVYNVKGLYSNTFLHTWKCYSVSPFQNAVALAEELPA